MHRSRPLVGALLATSSVIAMIAASSGPAYAVCTAIGNSGLTNPTGTTIPCALANNTTITGNVVNAGTITPGGPYGIKIFGGTLNGAIINSGTISGQTPSGSANGVWIRGAIATGGITNSGSISAPAKGILVELTPSFAGGITNIGQVTSPSASGIQVFNVSAFTGNISNSGTISTPSSAGIAVKTVSTFTGSIINSGTISTPSQAAIAVNTVSSFAGGITNSGTISAAGSSGAIIVETIRTFTSGITNSGPIVFTGSGGSAAAIVVDAVSAFSGGISNAGTISASHGAGIRLGKLTSSGAVLSVSTFAGGITNSGTITAAQTGIVVTAVSTFSGWISNAGTISATAGAGIKVAAVGTVIGGSSTVLVVAAPVSAFSGGISNSGLISASAGAGIQLGGMATTTSDVKIFAAVSTFSGGITNTGTIRARTGILAIGGVTFGGGISNAGTISVQAAGIEVGIRTGSGIVASVATFTGGITNSGTITAATGILTVGVGSFTGGISNAGTISASLRAISVGLTSGNVGVSTFSGGITNSGTLTAGRTGILVATGGTFADGIANSGTITAATHDIFINQVSTFTGGITNSGSLTVTGAASGIDISHVSIFAGGITNSGTIAAGTAAIGLINISSFSGGISNGGTLTATISGIAVTSVSTFSGGITNSGRIQSGGASAISIFQVTNFSGGVTNSGTISGNVGLIVSGGASFSGAIANSGNITGTTAAIDLSAAPNAMTINQTAGTIAGAIKLSPFADVVNVTGGTVNGNIVGQGAGNIVNFTLGGGTFTYGSSFSISGVHQLNVNSGVVILEGTNSATNVAVNGGTLEIGDASHPGAQLTATGGVTVGVGGTLEGHGMVIGSLTVPSGATLAPGGSIGTLNVTGNLSIAAGSFYQITVNAAGQNSNTVATGTATIAGGTVQVIQQPGTYPSSFKYTILTANGGVTGTFAGAVTSSAFFTPTLSYDADDAFLTLTRNRASFAGQAQTRNQQSVGGALDASAGSSALVQALGVQPAATIQQVLDLLSGEVYGSVQSELIDDSHYMRQALLGRLRQSAYADAPGSMGALGFAGPVTIAPSAESLALAYGAIPVRAAPVVPTYGSDIAYWAQGVGAWGRSDGDGNAADMRRTLAGFFTGLDARFGLARIGVAGGYTHSSLSIEARASSAGIDTAHLGAYADTNLGAFSLRAGAAYSFHTIDAARTIAVPGLLDTTRAHFDGGTGQLFGEVGYGMALGPVAAEPFAGLAFVHVRTDSFAEAGGVTALNGANSTDDVGYSSLGLRVATSYMLQNGMTLIPRASVAWQRAFGDVTPTAALAFQSTGAGFAVSGVPLSRDAALVETGLDLRFNPQARLDLSYSGELAGRLQDHTVKGTFTWNF